jgi:hypothetical protein
MASPKQLAVYNTDYHNEMLGLVSEAQDLVAELLNMRNNRMINDFELNRNYAALKWSVDTMRDNAATYEAVYEVKIRKLKEKAAADGYRYAGNPMRGNPEMDKV